MYSMEVVIIERERERERSKMKESGRDKRGRREEGSQLKGVILNY